MLEKLEAVDIEKQSGESSSRVSSQRVGAKDILIKETEVCLEYGNFKVTVKETLRFRPPQTSKSKQPNANIAEPRVSADVLEQAPELRVGRVSSFVDALTEEDDGFRARRRP